MANGDFNTRMDTTDCTENSPLWRTPQCHFDGMSIAIEQHTKSERMKTELITNVSHDIKTPLTSILNYVDLLQHTNDEAERAQYLEVLHRQATRLKKLTEDLVEASKAATGNIQTDLVPTDVSESLNQAVGGVYGTAGCRRFDAGTQIPGLWSEYSGGWPPSVAGFWTTCWATSVNMLCRGPGLPDGRGTGKDRVYPAKDISRQQLNISPDELMERFVRGDSARSTEGSAWVSISQKA